MRLSEALRLGEFAVEPYYGDWIVAGKDKNVCGACAVGRASMAAGYVPGLARHVSFMFKTPYRENLHEISKFWSHAWPWTAEFEPAGSFESEVEDCGNTVLAMISDLYEHYRMPISMIAAYIETIEPQDLPHTEAQEVTDINTVSQLTK